MKVTAQDEIARWVDVWQGGEIVNDYCTEANDVEGYTMRVVVGDDGRLIVDGDEVKTARHDGPVAIYMKLDAPEHACKYYRFAKWVDSLSALREQFADLVTHMSKTGELLTKFEADAAAHGFTLPKDA